MPVTIARRSVECISKHPPIVRTIPDMIHCINFLALIACIALAFEVPSEKICPSKSQVTFFWASDQETSRYSKDLEEAWRNPWLFRFRIRNNTDSPIRMIDPKAYRLYPHPWIVRIDGESSNIWPGGLICAPSFTEKDIITIPPGKSRPFTVSWTRLTYSMRNIGKGKHRLSLRYHYEQSANRRREAAERDITEISTGWTRPLTIEIL